MAIPAIIASHQKRIQSLHQNRFGHSEKTFLPENETISRGVVRAFREGKSPGEICQMYPDWKPSQIYAVIAVYLRTQENGGE
jgi:hypothetical protein